MATPNKNKYLKGTHISECKFRQLIKCFSLDLNAYETSKITNISYTTCKKIYQKLRIYIYKNLLENSIDDGEFELDVPQGHFLRAVLFWCKKNKM